ncbi:putative exopolyphosphatase [Astathelohania contejeani]|uniref:inorganic diphosphatase n=1 Tax=Astathelohania contejeani TaxID=164912 RepID=A0ABQ7HZK2_9MICR|nr:putative exopolyphosphatase [Thelohania contejeani]
MLSHATKQHFKDKVKKYLKENHKRIRHTEIVMVIGNEACDLDSFVSSLVLAYAEDYIHVVNMKKEVFKCKGELMWLCNTFGIESDDLIYLERPDGDFGKQTKADGTYFRVDKEIYTLAGKDIKLILTDHNKPVFEISRFKIKMIIDHHQLESSVANASTIYIDVDVGSCTTLVSRYLGHNLSKKHHCRHPSLLKKAESKDGTLCSAFARLMLIPIIIDTKMLRNRTSVFDKLEYKKLKKEGRINKKRLKKIRKIIQSARKNDYLYSNEIILQKDYKEYEHRGYVFGTSVVKYNFEDWIEREIKIKGRDLMGVQFEMALESFRRRMGLDFLLVLCKWKRVRYIIILGFPYKKQLIENEKFIVLTYRGVTYFRMPKKYSRKVIVPLIEKMLDNKK